MSFVPFPVQRHSDQSETLFGKGTVTTIVIFLASAAVGAVIAGSGLRTAHGRQWRPRSRRCAQSYDSGSWQW